MEPKGHGAGNHHRGSYQLESGRVVITEAGRLGSEAPRVKAGKEDHERMEEGSFPVEPQDLVRHES